METIICETCRQQIATPETEDEWPSNGVRVHTTREDKKLYFCSEKCWVKSKLNKRWRMEVN